MSKIPFLKTASAISAIVGGKPVMIPTEHPNHDDVLDQLVKGTATADSILEAMSLRAFVLKKSFGDVRIEGETVYYKNKVLEGLLVKRLIEAVRSENADKLDRLMMFTDSLGRNPSFRIREQLFPFLEKGNNPISKNGGFIVFKKLDANFKDVRTHTFDNSVGKKVSMPREEVNDDPNQTCSAGLHVCNWEYLSHYSGSKVVLCEVFPEHVVSVPTDYDNTKMRVCEYDVIADVTGQNHSQVFDGRLYW